MINPEGFEWRKDNNRSGALFKHHETQVTDFKIVVILACQDHPHLELNHFGRGKPYFDQIETIDPETEERLTIPIRPDGWIQMKDGDSYVWFLLEVDGGTMRLDRIRTKLLGFSAYYAEGGFLRRYGQNGAQREDYPFRVLMTCPSETTRNNRMEQACRVKAPRLCLFGVFDEVIKDPLGPVWIQGKDYQDALQHLPPDI